MGDGYPGLCDDSRHIVSIRKGEHRTGASASVHPSNNDYQRHIESSDHLGCILFCPDLAVVKPAHNMRDHRQVCLYQSGKGIRDPVDTESNMADLLIGSVIADDIDQDLIDACRLEPARGIIINQT